MIPQGSLLNNTAVQYTKQPSKTYRLRRDKDKIQGYVDGLSAIEQAVYKILSTERYEHLIYGFNYGIEWKSLIGKDPLYIRADVKRRVEEALLQDEHIERVENFNVVLGEELDAISISFTVVTAQGELGIQKEVNLNG